MERIRVGSDNLASNHLSPWLKAKTRSCQKDITFRYHDALK